MRLGNHEELGTRERLLLAARSATPRRLTARYLIVMASPLRSAFAISPTCRPASSRTAPFGVVCGAVARSLFALVALSALSVLCVCAGTNPLGPGAEVMSSGEWQISEGTGYGLAGLGHLFGPNRNFKERTALVSDLAIFVLLAVFAVSRAV